MSESAPPVDLRPDHRAIVCSILRQHVPDRKVLVFGSRATWTAKDYSDLDLAILGGEPLPLDVITTMAEGFGEADLPFKVDLVEWAKIDQTLRNIIRRDGVAVQVPADLFSASHAARGPLPVCRTSSARDNDDDGATKRGWLFHPPFPAQWQSCSLYSMATWINGIAFRNIQFSETGRPVVKIAEIKGGISGQTKFTQQKFDDSVLLRSGDLLFSWSGQPETSIDAFWWRGPEGWLNQHIFRVTPGAGIDPGFFYYLLRYLKPNFVGIARNKQTTGLGHVTRRDLESMEVAYPDFSEQRAIAHILGTLDDQIDLNRRMNETLEAMARAVFRDWFVDFGPVRAKVEGREPYLSSPTWGLFPDAFEREGVPRGWEWSKIGKEVRAVGGGTPSTKEGVYWEGGDRHWATPKDLARLSSPVLLETERKITDSGVRKISSGLLPVGTVLLSSRAPIGYLAITAVSTAINQGFIAMVCDRRLPNIFVLFWCAYHLDHIKGIAGGSTFAEISKKAFRPLHVVVPSQEILTAYMCIVRPLYDRIVANAKESSLLAQTRDLLLPKLISGDIRVRDAEKMVEAVA
ncbi:MAG: restriction endonuclease subunit S [Rhodospirillales bacterium]|nr:restriction endonuclease subunit S [Rhodospirillales bacterium]